VLVGSVMAAIAASIVLRIRNNTYARLWAEENRDDDGDGIPDVYQGDADRLGDERLGHS
jgi:NhaA family Na+:H+ antiporter